MSDIKQILTFADVKVTDTFSAQPFLSENGRKAYANFQIDVIPNRVNIAAEWYDNNNGQLVIVDQVLEDNDPFNPIGVDNGEASNDFKYFSLLDESAPDEFTSLAGARLRVYNENHALVATRVFGAEVTDPYPYWGDFSFNGGNFSRKNKYIAVSYVFTPPGSLSQTSVLRIVDASQPTLPDVFAPYEYEGNTSLNPKFITIKNKCQIKTFVFLQISGGIFDADINAPASQPPFLLRVLKLQTNLKLIIEKRFAQIFAFSILQKSKEKALVAISVSRNVKPAELTEYIDNTDNIADGDFFRDLGIFVFDGHKLLLESQRNFKLGAGALWHPSGKYLLSSVNPAVATFISDDVVYRTTGPSTGFWLKLECEKPSGLVIKNADADLFPRQIRSTAFISANGKWLFVTSSDTPFPTIDGTPAGQILYNFVLYRLHVDSDC